MLAGHFQPPSGRLRTGGRYPEWARGKMCGCLFWITNREGKQLGYEDQEKAPWSEGRIGVKTQAAASSAG